MDLKEITSQLDKLDIEILFLLYRSEKNNQLNSCKIKDLIDIKDSCVSKVSYYTVVRRIGKLVECGFVDIGYKVSNAKTYFINEVGIDYINTEILSCDNAYEDIDEEIE